MRQRRYQNLIGQTIGQLEIYSIGRYENNEPIWLCRCLECGSTGVAIPHRLFRQGNARCPASICGQPETLPAPSSRLQVTSREYGSIPWVQPVTEEEQQPVDPEVERRQAAKAAEQQRLRTTYREYWLHQTKTKIKDSDIVPFERWRQLQPSTRQMVLDRLRADPKIYFQGL